MFYKWENKAPAHTAKQATDANQALLSSNEAEAVTSLEVLKTS